MTHSSQRFCLRWNNHHSNLLSVFDQLLLKESFVDVTLAVEGQLLKAHKVILSACSPYFETLFVSHPDKHPIVILKDVPFADMRSLLDFIYRGEVSVDQDRLTGFLKVAESLRIKGLTEVNEEKCDLPSIASSLLSSNSQQATVPPPAVPPPPPSLHRIHLGQPSSSPSSLSSPNASTSSNKRCIPSPSNFQPFSAHGPPDLLEVNMTEHSQNSPSSFSEDQNIESPLPDDSCLETSEDCCVKTEPNDDLSVSGTSFTECRSPRTKDSPGSRSQSQTPTNASERYPPDLPLLRLVPKSELMAVFRKDSSHKGEAQNDDILTTSGHSTNTDIGDHRNSNNNNNNNNNNVVNNNNNNNDNYSSTSCNSGGGSNISNNNGNNGNINNNDNNINDNNNSGSNCTGGNSNNNNDSNHDNFLFNSASSHFMLNNETKFSPPPHLLSPRSNTSSTPGTPTADAASKTTATRRRVRRRATSSSDPAEQLTEMSVRGLNLFRYACIDDGVYKCLECAKTDIVKTFKNKYSFQRHAFLYHEGCQRKVFPCLVCSKEFSRPDKMKNHMKTVHDCFMPKECVVPKECLFPPPPPTIPFFLSPP